jgi:hypothetical protein
MGWTKHPDAVRAHQERRREALSNIKSLAKEIAKVLKDPELFPSKAFELGSLLHTELQGFAYLCAAVGGGEDEDMRPYFDLLFQTIPSFEWRPNASQSFEHECPGPRDGGHG